MRKAILTAAALPALMALAPAAHAQQQGAGIETRVDRIEKELRAVQRKVFPAGAPVEAQITQAPSTVVPGTPASSPVQDLIARVDALEQQMATLTGQTEQNAYRIKQLEDAFNRYKAETDATLSPTVAPPAVAPTASAGRPAAPAPAKPAAASGPAGDARKTAVAAIERPSTGDAAGDAYNYGYRLWDAKFYPEAQAQLKDTITKYGATSVGSRAQNLLGRAYLDDGKPALASVEFYENYSKRPKGERAADSLAWLGEALIQLKKPADACKVYQELQDVYGATLSATLRGMMEKGRVRAKCGG
jgi:TolA-binding protein